jgi:hypothetical protein
VKPILTERDFEEAARLLGCEVAAIAAVSDVEAPRGGFNQDGSPVTLFEGHWFHRFTGGRFDADYPRISYPNWTRQFYGKTQAHEKERLEIACSLDRRAGLMSASWGKFQIMGFNHALAGFKSVQDFVNAMYRSEREHLLAFCRYVQHECMDDELRERRWDAFALRYNGREYRKNRYAERLMEAHLLHSGKEMARA